LALQIKETQCELKSGKAGGKLLQSWRHRLKKLAGHKIIWNYAEAY
jgi:hypothetical protein